MSNGKLVSPIELHKAACDSMLFGDSPVTLNDWVLIVNFYAVNIAKEVQPSATLLLCKIMDCPLREDFIADVVNFQLKQPVK
jgi:hypothetical protein